MTHPLAEQCGKPRQNGHRMALMTASRYGRLSELKPYNQSEQNFALIKNARRLAMPRRVVMKEKGVGSRISAFLMTAREATI
jgi:hypothetical protein